MADVKHSESSEASIPGPNVAEAYAGQGNGKTRSNGFQHPSGRKGYGKAMQILRGVLLALYFAVCCAWYVVVAWS